MFIIRNKYCIHSVFHLQLANVVYIHVNENYIDMYMYLSFLHILERDKISQTIKCLPTINNCYIAL